MEMDSKLEKCKYCDAELSERHYRKLPRTILEEKQGIWGGMEFPYLDIYKVTCPNKGVCGKKFSVRVRGSRWLYK